MGEVYRATDTALERPVAVKLLSERYTEEPEARARFQREAHAAARLSSNRNIVTVFDVGEHHGRAPDRHGVPRRWLGARSPP